jgi:hypothetical protein
VLALENPRLFYDLLFAASAQTLLEIAIDRKHLGAEIGVISILHTWGQNLLLHPHIHCAVPAGGLSLDHHRWVRPRYPFFLPEAHYVDLVDINTSFVDGADIWTGTEAATFDFGRGDTLQLSAEFVTEHMNDSVASSGVFHINEIGTFTKGTGSFRNAYGHWIMQGPFGPSVTLPSNIQPPPDADLYWIGQYHGTLCGIS